MTRVTYIYSRTLQDAADQLPANPGRSSIVHSLCHSLGLLRGGDEAGCSVICPDPDLATSQQLRKYHTPGYVDLLLQGDDVGDASAAHGLEHDCPAFPVLPTYAVQVAAATLTACRLLAQGSIDIALAWDGGRHHALRDRASGFCYVADVVLGIMLLKRAGKRVMYLDLDLHYGDGVALAFQSPVRYVGTGQKAPPILTLSIHHAAPAFFPVTAAAALTSSDTTSPFTLSLPLHAYPSRTTYAAIFPSIERVYHAYRPDCVVVQFGADGLPGDPVGQFGNWSTHGEGGMLWMAGRLKDWGIPLCVLGGGGYKHANTARAWAGITATMVRRSRAG